MFTNEREKTYHTRMKFTRHDKVNGRWTRDGIEIILEVDDVPIRSPIHQHEDSILITKILYSGAYNFKRI